MRTSRSRRLLASSAALTASLAMLAACGDSSSTAGAGDPSSSGGGTIKVLQITMLNTPSLDAPESIVAAKAYLSVLNAAGGINGTKVELETCNSEGDPNKEVACFQQAVTDHVVAVVGSIIQIGTGYDILEKAGIPAIGSFGATDVDYKAAASYPASGGTITYGYGLLAQLAKAGAKKIVTMNCEYPGCVIQKDLIAKGAADLGITTDDVEIKIASTTFDAQAAKVVGMHPDGVAIATSTNDTPKALKALRAAGYTGPVATSDIVTAPEILKAMGSDAEGLLIASAFAPYTDTSNPEVKRFTDAMKAEDSSASLDPISQSSWNGFDLFAKVAQTVDGEITPASLTAALNAVTTPIDLGMSGAWLPPNADKPLLPDYPRVGSVNFVPEVVNDGAITATADSADVFKTLASLK